MAYKRKSTEEKQKEIENLTKTMEEKINSYFVSTDSIKEHLAFMSTFYKYSPRNMALIESQYQGAVAVGSFNYWKEKGVSVKKGEKGIKILVPTPIEYFNRGLSADGKINWVQVKFANAKEKEEIKKGSIETRKKLFFKVGHVFEYRQTNAREIGLPVSEIFDRYYRNGTVEHDKEFIKALEKISNQIGVSISLEPIHELGTAKGAFYRELNTIALNPRNTEIENVTVMLHELAHSELHNEQRLNKRDVPLLTYEKEFQAEMVAYVVATHYNIPTENFSLSYLANWTKGKEFDDKEQLLREVRETSSNFIDTIDKHFENVNLLEKNNAISLNEEQLKTLESLHFWRRNQLAAKRNNDEMEVSKSDLSIRQLFNRADAQEIPFKIQNRVIDHADNKKEESFSDMEFTEERNSLKPEHSIKLTSIENGIYDVDTVAELTVTNGITDKEHVFHVYGEDVINGEIEPFYIFFNDPINANYETEKGDIEGILDDSLFQTTLSDIVIYEDSLIEKIKNGEEFELNFTDQQQIMNLHSIIVNEEIADLMIKYDKDLLNKNDFVSFGKLIEHDTDLFDINSIFEKEKILPIIDNAPFEENEIMYTAKAFEALNMAFDTDILSLGGKANVQIAEEKNKKTLNNNEMVLER